MKKWLILLGVAFVTNGYSQTVFAPPGATWIHSYYGFDYDFTGSWFIWGAQEVKYEKDTIVNSIAYKLLRQNNVYYSGRFGNRRIENSNALCIRQSNDTIYAFRRMEDNKNREDLYFVFLEKPDSVINCFPTNDRCNKVYIDSITSKQIGNRTLKNWEGKSYVPYIPDAYSYDTFPLQFVERIGPINDLFSYFGFRGHPVASLIEVTFHCYSDNEWGEINLSGTPCNLVLSSKDPKREPLKWNCFIDNNNLQLELSEESNYNIVLQLSDLQGRIILSKQINVSSNTILLPKHLTSGIYIVRIADPLNGVYDAKKIFITNH